MSLTDLPKELIVDICKRACVDMYIVNITLQNLAQTCWNILNIIRENLYAFIKMYLYKCENYNSRRETEIVYKFGSWIHNIDDLPAIINIDGSKSWYQYGKLHRNYDQPAVIRVNKRAQAVHARQCNCGSVHIRDGQKSMICNHEYTMEWWYRGRRHRANGYPAITWSNGNEEFWVDGKRMSIKKEK